MLVDVARRRLRDWPKPAISSMGESVSGTRATANPRPTDSREARCQVQTVLDITSEVPDTRRPQASGECLPTRLLVHTAAQGAGRYKRCSHKEHNRLQAGCAAAGGPTTACVVHWHRRLMFPSGQQELEVPASESAQMRTSLFTKAEQERGRGTDGRGPKGQCSGSLALDEMKTQAVQKHSDAEAAPLANPMLSCLQIQILHQSVHFVLKASGNGCEEALRLPRSLEWQAGQTCRLTAQLMACRSHRCDSRSERGTSARRHGKSNAQTTDACKTKLSGPSLDLHSCNTGLPGW